MKESTKDSVDNSIDELQEIKKELQEINRLMQQIIFWVVVFYISFMIFV